MVFTNLLVGVGRPADGEDRPGDLVSVSVEPYRTTVFQVRLWKLWGSRLRWKGDWRRDPYLFFFSSEPIMYASASLYL